MTKVTGFLVCYLLSKNGKMKLILTMPFVIIKLKEQFMKGDDINEGI